MNRFLFCTTINIFISIGYNIQRDDMMIVNKAYRYRIYPTDAQKVFFAKTFGCVRFIYNVKLYDKIQHYEELGQMLKNTPTESTLEEVQSKVKSEFRLIKNLCKKLKIEVVY